MIMTCSILMLCYLFCSLLHTAAYKRNSTFVKAFLPRLNREGFLQHLIDAKNDDGQVGDELYCSSTVVARSGQVEPISAADANGHFH